MSTGLIQRGDLILLVIFASGLMWGAAVIEWSPPQRPLVCGHLGTSHGRPACGGILTPGRLRSIQYCGNTISLRACAAVQMSRSRRTRRRPLHQKYSVFLGGALRV